MISLSPQQRGRWNRKVPLIIKHKKLGRYNLRKCSKRQKRIRCFGMWQRAGLVWVDPRQKDKSYVDTLIHEMLHEYAPEWTENRVRRTASKIAKQLWAFGIKPTVTR